MSRRSSSISTNLVRNLAAFVKESKIRKTALLALSFTASSKDLEDLAIQFKEFDQDNSQSPATNTLSYHAPWLPRQQPAPCY